MKKLMILLIVVLLAGAFSLSTAASTGEIVIAIPNEPANLDLHRDTPRQTKKIQHFLNDPLIFQDPDTLEYMPGLAHSWEISSDGRIWTFHLREDVLFHNGDPLTAEDFRYTYERILDPETQAMAARSDVGSLESVRVLDEYSFELHFEEPFAAFYHWLAHGWLMPLNQRAVDYHGADYGQNPVGTGPFMFKEWRPGQYIRLVRNPDYAWGPAFYENQGAPYVDEIEFRVISDLGTTLVGLETGELDGADHVADKDVEALRRNPDIDLFRTYVPGVGLYGAFNHTSPLFSDVDVRRAFIHAVDRNVMVQVVKQGNAVVAYGPFPYFFLGFDQDVEEYGYPYDPQQANAILDEAGWVKEADGIRAKDGVRLSGLFLVRNRNDYILAAQLIQNMVGEIGIDLELQILEFGALSEQLFAGRHDFALMGYGTGEPDALNLFMHSSQIGRWNIAHVSDPIIDDLLGQARVATDLAERAELYRQFQRRAVEDLAVWLPIYTDIQYTPMNSRITGVEIHPLGWLLLNDARIVH